jgi:predicted nucleotidyltransferase
MSEPSAAARRLQAVLAAHRVLVDDVLHRYGASNPRVFGSVARGDAREDSDLDLLVDLAPGLGNELLRVSGLAEDLSQLLGVHVDVVAPPLLRDVVSATALADAVPV